MRMSLNLNAKNRVHYNFRHIFNGDKSVYKAHSSLNNKGPIMQNQATGHLLMSLLREGIARLDFAWLALAACENNPPSFALSPSITKPVDPFMQRVAQVGKVNEAMWQKAKPHTKKPASA